MSERYGERSPQPEEPAEGHGLYQGAALELMSTCMERMMEAEGEAEPTNDISGGFYLEAPSDYDLPEWDCIDVEIFPKNSKDKKGNDRMVRVELLQDIDASLRLIERYTLLYDGQEFKVVRRFRLYDGMVDDENKKETNISEELAVTKQEINGLTELVFTAELDED